MNSISLGQRTDKILYTAAEACHALGYSRSKLWMEMKEGRIAWANNGRRRLIARAELERYASTLTQTG